MVKKSYIFVFTIFSFFNLLSFSFADIGSYLIYGNILIRGIYVPQGPVIWIGDMWQDYAHVTKNRNDNNYFIFWEEKDPVGYDILGVIMNLDGTMASDPFIVSGETENDHRMPKAAYNPDDNQFLVVFLYRSPGGNTDVRGRIVNSDGTVSGGDIIIADGSPEQNMPTVAYSTVSQEYMVAYDVDFDPNVDDRNIYGRRIARDGSPIGDEFPISTAPKDQFYSEIAYNPDLDQYLVVWEDFRFSTAEDSWLGKGDIYGSIIDAQGNPVVVDVPASTNVESQYMPAVEYSTVSHLYFVSFNDHREGPIYDPYLWYNANIMGRMVGQDGSLYSDEFTICNAPNNQIFSSVAVDPVAGTFCVVWDDGREMEEATATMDIYTRFYDAFGNPLGGEFTLCRLSGQQHWPIVEARGEDEEFFAVWGDGRKNPENVEPRLYPDIYGQIFSRQKREFGIECITNLEGSEGGLTGLRVTLSHGSLETEGITGEDGSFYVCGFETGQVVTLTPEDVEGYIVEPPSITVTIEGEDVVVEFDFLVDSDNDGISNDVDNCPNHPNGPDLGTCYSWSGMESGTTCMGDGDCDDGVCNMNQEDTYPPDGNGIGDVCDCKGDFDCDGDVDGTDASTFKLYFGRSPNYYPCNELNPCHGDFTCDQDVDGTDAALFKSDFGRSLFNNPCPACVVGDWCSY